MKTIIVWFRNDLRVHDHPALSAACQDADHVIPLFIFDAKLANKSANRTRFLLESLQDLRQSLNSRGADLVIREGDALKQLAALCKEQNVTAIYYSADFTPYALKRDKAIKASLPASVVFRGFAGRLAVSSLDKIHTKSGDTYKVFTPFWKSWQQVARRELASTLRKITIPTGVSVGKIPTLKDLVRTADLSPTVQKGGETAARKKLHAFIQNEIYDYKADNNNLAKNGTSKLSAYLHFGCLSPREIETILPESASAEAWHRQLAWREFYHYVLYKNPANTNREFQAKYRDLKWDSNEHLLRAWQTGQTGYPVVDAAMRQLHQEGWMHNRGRLIVGSFLTKDLWLDWRAGEEYFMRMLIDGDSANNNGNWQWIASVGVDPAPVFRRLYNPASQRDTYDPEGVYTRTYVPELRQVPNKYLSEPWKMPHKVQLESNCIIGKDYPEPIVDHAQARKAALERYRVR